VLVPTAQLILPLRATIDRPNTWISELLQIGVRQYDLRFWNAGEDGFDIEAVLLVTVAPAAPAAWQIWPIEGEGSCLEVQEEGEQAWRVVCGKPFTVALELVDEFGNKCVVSLS
jgi:hypothetical protein